MAISLSSPGLLSPQIFNDQFSILQSIFKYSNHLKYEVDVFLSILK